MIRFAVTILFIAVTVLPESIHAQQRASATFPAAIAGQRSGGSAFLVEAAGGTAGSLLGFGLIFALSDDCEAENLSCNLENAALAIVTGTVTSALGAYFAGKWANTNPSGLGAALGAVAGAAAGLGVWHLMAEELNVVHSTTGEVLSYTITQGVVTALGSRLLRFM